MYLYSKKIDPGHKPPILCYGHKINLPRFNDLLISEARNQQQRQEYV